MANIPQAGNVFQIGGAVNSAINTAVLPANTTIIALAAGISSSTSGNALRFQKMGGTSQGAYQVTSGKTFYCLGMYVVSSTGNRAQFGHATASFSNNTAIGSLTGPIYYGGAGGGTGNDIYSSGIVVSTTYQWIPLVGVSFPATVYPFIQFDSSSSAASVMLIGYEI